MIEIVAIEIVDIHGMGARRHERIDFLVLEKDLKIAGDLIAIILADRASAGLRIVTRPDFRQQHQLGVGEGIGAERDEPVGCSYSAPLAVSV